MYFYVVFTANLTDWRMLLHGTETLPGSSDEENDGLGRIPVNPPLSNNISTRYSNSGGNTPNKGSSSSTVPLIKVADMGGNPPWHDDPHPHNEVQRTTTEDANSGTDCKVLARSGHLCIGLCLLVLLLTSCHLQSHTSIYTKQVRRGEGVS